MNNDFKKSNNYLCNSVAQKSLTMFQCLYNLWPKPDFRTNECATFLKISNTQTGLIQNKNVKTVRLAKSC